MNAVRAGVGMAACSVILGDQLCCESDFDAVDANTDVDVGSGVATFPMDLVFLIIATGVILLLELEMLLLMGPVRLFATTSVSYHKRKYSGGTLGLLFDGYRLPGEAHPFRIFSLLSNLCHL